MLEYCKRCGRIVLNSENIPGRKCDTCDYPIMTLVPQKYCLNKNCRLINSESKELLREELVKTSPEYDEYWFNNRDKIRMQKSAEYDSVASNIKFDSNNRAYYAGNNLLKCPTCNSTNIKSIGTFNRMASVGLFGLASGKIGKTRQCKSCGYTW